MTLSTAQGWLAAVWGKAREAAGNMGKRTDVCPYKKANGQSDRRQKTDAQTDRQTDRQTDQLKNRQWKKVVWTTLLHLQFINAVPVYKYQNTRFVMTC